jgi:hypothetical protein
MLLPALAAAKKKAQKINCVNNLKQIGLAFRIWSGDNGDKYPQSVPYTSGGAQDYVGHGTTAASVLNPAMVFMVMSNELSTPKVAYCPSDSYQRGQAPASTFAYTNFIVCAAPTGTTKAGVPTAAGAASYFVNGDAQEADPQMILSGDVNIGSQSATANNNAADYGFTTANAGASTAPTQCSAQATTTTAMGLANGAWAWTKNENHQKTGNIGLADGSVQSVSVKGLHDALISGTNTLVTQSFNFPR